MAPFTVQHINIKMPSHAPYDAHRTASFVISLGHATLMDGRVGVGHNYTLMVRSRAVTSWTMPLCYSVRQWSVCV